MREEILQAVLRKRIIFVIGAKDTGKTTLIKDLANACFQQGYSVGVIDADVGQSDIGPPTTIGLGTVGNQLERLGDAMLRSFSFVGATSPKGHLLPMLIGVRQMLDRALSLNVQKIFIDTTGLVSGRLGSLLKESKIALVQPDLIICLQNNDECEHLLRRYDMFEHPTIVRLKPDPQCRSRTTAARRSFRESALRDWFSRATPFIYSLDDIHLLGTILFQGKPHSFREPQEFLNTYQEFEDLLVGLLNRQGDYCALGILRSIDFSTRQATIVTTASHKDIVAVQLSNYSMRDA
jgi:polynucleotide 5'-hydroxyl-kinase GRC3/NOL9